MKMRHRVPLIGLVCALLLSSHPALAQFSQQGPKSATTGKAGGLKVGAAQSRLDLSRLKPDLSVYCHLHLIQAQLFLPLLFKLHDRIRAFPATGKRRGEQFGLVAGGGRSRLATLTKDQK